MECTEVARTSKNDKFIHTFHDSGPQISTSAWYMSPCRTCTYCSTVDWKWSILGVVYYRSWMEYVAVTRTWRFSSNSWFWHDGLLWLWDCCSEGPGEQPDMTTLNEITCSGVVSYSHTPLLFLTLWRPFLSAAREPATAASLHAMMISQTSRQAVPSRAI